MYGFIIALDTTKMYSETPLSLRNVNFDVLFVHILKMM